MNFSKQSFGLHLSEKRTGLPDDFIYLKPAEEVA